MNTWLPRPWGRLAFVRRTGAGLPLVFLHGTGCDNADWAPTLAALPADQPWVAVEFRAHGASDAPQASFTLTDLAEAVSALLAALELPAACLVGHSLGGMVAQAVAARSARVVSLVLLEGWVRLAVVREAFGPEHHFGRLTPAARQAILAKYDTTRARVPAACWEHFWRSVEAFDAAPYLATATLPIVAAYGACAALPGAEAKLGVPAKPNVRWLWVPDAGHYLPHEAPAATAQAALSALVLP